MTVEHQSRARKPYWKVISTDEFTRCYTKDTWLGSRWRRAELGEVPQEVLLAMDQELGRFRAKALGVSQVLLREGERRQRGTADKE